MRNFFSLRLVGLLLAFMSWLPVSSYASFDLYQYRVGSFSYRSVDITPELACRWFATFYRFPYVSSTTTSCRVITEDGTLEFPITSQVGGVCPSNSSGTGTCTCVSGYAQAGTTPESCVAAVVESMSTNEFGQALVIGGAVLVLVLGYVVGRMR